MSKWQPIETAPKDGSQILVYRNGLQYVARWMAHPWLEWGVNIKTNGEWQPFQSIGKSKDVDPDWPYREAGPSHWMPLPEPPTRSASGAERQQET